MSSPKNYIRSRNNSSSSTRSVCNHIHLNRQNTFPTRRRKVNSQSSNGSGYLAEDFKPNDLSDNGGGKQEASSESNTNDEEDPDAMDEAVIMFVAYMYLTRDKG